MVNPELEQPEIPELSPEEHARRELYGRFLSYFGQEQYLMPTGPSGKQVTVHEGATLSGTEWDRELRGPKITGFVLSELERRYPEAADELLSFARIFEGDQSITVEGLGTKIFGEFKDKYIKAGEWNRHMRRELIQQGYLKYGTEPLIVETLGIYTDFEKLGLESGYFMDTIAASVTWFETIDIDNLRELLSSQEGQPSTNGPDAAA